MCIHNFTVVRKRKQYTAEALAAACAAVKSRRLSLYKAAREFSVPRMTISDHVNNRYAHIYTSVHSVRYQLLNTRVSSKGTLPLAGVTNVCMDKS